MQFEEQHGLQARMRERQAHLVIVITSRITAPTF
jgi:hypothetical protein